MNYSKWQKVYNKQKKNLFFSIDTGFIFIEWYENYRISWMAIATSSKEIFIFIGPLDENKFHIIWKKT